MMSRDKTLKALLLRNDWLKGYAKNVTSQYGEDGILRKIFQVLGRTKGWCVEFGAGDGKTNSNVWVLMNREGWSGVLIESDNRQFQKLNKLYQRNDRVICIYGSVGFRGNSKLDIILKKTFTPHAYDLLVIDVDGNDYHIWDAVNKYIPKVVMIEFNPSIPNNITFIQPKNEAISQGSSLLAITQLARKKGYELVSVTDCNALFVRKRYYALFGINDNSLSVMRANNIYETQIYQLYDGTLSLAGCSRLIWHDERINIQKLQTLPIGLRTFPPKMKASQKVQLLQYNCTSRLWRGFKHLIKRIIQNLRS